MITPITQFIIKVISLCYPPLLGKSINEFHYVHTPEISISDYFLRFHVKIHSWHYQSDPKMKI